MQCNIILISSPCTSIDKEVVGLVIALDVFPHGTKEVAVAVAGKLKRWLVRSRGVPSHV